MKEVHDGVCFHVPCDLFFRTCKCGAEGRRLDQLRGFILVKVNELFAFLIKAKYSLDVVLGEIDLLVGASGGSLDSGDMCHTLLYE